jgi:hypothetical protein
MLGELEGFGPRLKIVVSPVEAPPHEALEKPRDRLRRRQGPGRRGLTRSASRQAGAVITDVSSEVTLTESDGSRVEVYRRIVRLDDHVLNRRPLSRDRRHRPSGSRRAPVPESPIIAANCGFPLWGSTLAAPSQEPLQVMRNPAAGRRRQDHPLHASHARGRRFKSCRARRATFRGAFRALAGSTDSMAR